MRIREIRTKLGKVFLWAVQWVCCGLLVFLGSAAIMMALFLPQELIKQGGYPPLNILGGLFSYSMAVVFFVSYDSLRRNISTKEYLDLVFHKLIRRMTHA